MHVYRGLFHYVCRSTSTNFSIIRSNRISNSSTRQRHTANRPTTEYRLTAFDYVYYSFRHLFYLFFWSDLMTDSIRWFVWCVSRQLANISPHLLCIRLFAVFRLLKTKVVGPSELCCTRLIAVDSEKWKENILFDYHWLKGGKENAQYLRRVADNELLAISAIKEMLLTFLASSWALSGISFIPLIYNWVAASKENVFLFLTNCRPCDSQIRIAADCSCVQHKWYRRRWYGSIQLTGQMEFCTEF